MAVTKLADGTISVPEGIVRVLEEAGIEFVFGMPGGKTIPIYSALYDHRSTIRAVLVREEGIAAVMADVYGRLTGRPGVCMGQAAFMLTNGGMGLVEAFLSGSPVLILSDLSDGSPLTQHAPYQSGTGDYGSWDARNTIAGYTKRVFVAHEPAAGVHLTQIAIKHATTGQPGPVAVLYHSTVVDAMVDPEAKPRLYSTGPYLASAPAAAPQEHVEAAVRLLGEARRPVIVAGNGVRLSQAQAALRALADLLDIPVTTTGSGKGVFPETHPDGLGSFGNYGQEAANLAVAESDLVLAVGTKLGPSDTANENPALIDPLRQTLIQVDVDGYNAAWTYPIHQSLIGDARVVLEQLATAARDAELHRYEGADRVLEARRRKGGFDVPESTDGGSPIAPERLIKDLHTTLPDDAIVTCDAGENRLFMMHFFQTKGTMEYLQPAAVGGMGYAVPAALAAKLVHPNRPVVAVTGDGGFGMTMNGLMTAIEENIPITVVVLNNSALNWVRHGQNEKPIASKFADFDHAAIARAMGCEGIRVEDPDQIVPALRQAMSCGRTAVVDVITSSKLTFRDVASSYAPR